MVSTKSAWLTTPPKNPILLKKIKEGHYNQFLKFVLLMFIYENVFKSLLKKSIILHTLFDMYVLFVIDCSDHFDNNCRF